MQLQKASHAPYKSNNTNISFGTKIVFTTIQGLNENMTKNITKVRPSEIYPELSKGKNFYSKEIDVCTGGLFIKKKGKAMTHIATTMDIYDSLSHTNNNDLVNELDKFGPLSSAIALGGKAEKFSRNRAGFSFDVFGKFMEKVRNKTANITYFSDFENGTFNLLYLEEPDKLFIANSTWKQEDVPKTYTELGTVFKDYFVSKKDKILF